MAVKKPTTTDDVVKVSEPKSADGYVTVKAPFDGAKTSVPADILDALLASGYTKSK